LVGLFEQVDTDQVAEADVLDLRLVVQVPGGPLGERGHGFLASPVVTQAREIELDVLQPARALRLEALQGSLEDPQH